MADVTVISSEEVADAVCRLYRRINTELRPDVRAAIEQAVAREGTETAREMLHALLENERISRRDGVPLCQDTGLAVAFVRLGASVIVEGATLADAISEGVARATREHPLRASTVSDPLERANPGTNAPAIVHIEHAPGDEIEIRLLAKGGGAENASSLHMLRPADGIEGVMRAVVETVRQAGAAACPPVIVGVGVGGDFETAPLLAKRALLRGLDERNPDRALAALEAAMLTRVNALGIGPQGLGGRTTALAVLVETAPCHIASLPVAVNIACHSHRHGSVTLGGRRRGVAGPQGGRSR